MSDRLNVNPTRGTMLQLKDSLRGIRGTHDLLDRKREVLVRELLERVRKAEELESRSLNLFRAAHEALGRARMRMGSDRVEWIALSPTARLKAETGLHAIMGLRIPTVQIEVEPVSPPYGLGDTSAAIDQARERWLDVIRFLAEASGILTSVWRLTMELRKTRRQVNALESVIIPRYERTVSFIEDKLEEEEREDIVHTKKVKEMQEPDGGR